MNTKIICILSIKICKFIWGFLQVFIYTFLKLYQNGRIDKKIVVNLRFGFKKGRLSQKRR